MWHQTCLAGAEPHVLKAPRETSRETQQSHHLLALLAPAAVIIPERRKSA